MHPQTNYGHLIATVEIFTGKLLLRTRSRQMCRAVRLFEVVRMRVPSGEKAALVSAVLLPYGSKIQRDVGVPAVDRAHYRFV
jgi:hypothetical protein